MASSTAAWSSGDRGWVTSTPPISAANKGWSGVIAAAMALVFRLNLKGQ